MKKTFFTALVLSVSMMSASAIATTTPTSYDGEINFSGKIVNTTCTVNNSTTQNPMTVTLPTVNKTALNTVGKTVGQTNFKINLTNCAASNADITAVKAYFQGDKINSDGRLDTNIENVDIEILDGNGEKINLAASSADQTGAALLPSNAENGDITLNYSARYYATGVAADGDVASSVKYTIVYQ